MVLYRSKSDYILYLLVFLIVGAVVACTLYPLIYVFSMSISDSRQVLIGNVRFLPKGFSLEAFKTVLRNKDIYRYYYNTLWYTIVGTFCNVLATILISYPLSRKRFFLRKPLIMFVTFTMFFNAGMIPTYLVVVKAGLYDSRWAMILPTLTAAWYIIVARSFFDSLPEELFESARIDGVGEWRILWSIVLPISKPVIAVLTVYYATNHWNSYFPALLYLSDQKLHPMQIFLRRAVIQASPEAMQGFDMEALGASILAMMQVKYAVVVIVILPIILFYPLLQRYFVKGMMVGALKG
jgi:putative aldouronate transport system permease protein